MRIYGLSKSMAYNWALKTRTMRKHVRASFSSKSRRAGTRPW
jgi:hypothetical protein